MPYIYRVSRRQQASPLESESSKAEVTVTPASPESTEPEVSYRDLQAQAKAAGIPANQTADDLKKALGASSE